MIIKAQAYGLLFFIGVTGLTPVVTISKDGAVFASPVGAVTETGNGWYKCAFTAADMTADNIAVHIATVGYTNIDMLINTDVDITTSIPSAATNAAAVRTNLTTELGRIDATVSSRNATAPDNASITAIKAKTDNLPAAPAAVSDVPTAATTAAAVRTNLATELARIDTTVSSRNATTPPTAAANATAVRTELAVELARVDTTISSRNATAPDNANILLIKAKTDNLPADPADQSLIIAAIPTAATTAAAVRTNLATELARVDTTISSRNATAPDNANILLIKAKTDNLPVAPAAVSDVPTAATTAAAVRTNLTTELGRIDAAISSIASDPAVTADAVRTELAVELACIDVAISTRMANSNVLPTLTTVIGEAIMVSEDSSTTLTIEEM